MILTNSYFGKLDLLGLLVPEFLEWIVPIHYMHHRAMYSYMNINHFQDLNTYQIASTGYLNQRTRIPLSQVLRLKINYESQQKKRDLKVQTFDT